MGFNESHSAVENVVVITGKLISLPYGLKAGLNSESHYQQFYFLLLLLCTPPPACLCLSLSFFCFCLFLSTSYSLSPTRFFLTVLPLPSPCHIFKTFDMKPPVVLRGKCNAQSGSWHSIAHADPLAKKENRGCSDPLWVDCVHSVPQVWLPDWRKKTPVNLYVADLSWCRGSQPCVQRITWWAIKRVLMSGSYRLRD